MIKSQESPNSALKRDCAKARSPLAPRYAAEKRRAHGRTCSGCSDRCPRHLILARVRSDRL